MDNLKFSDVLETAVLLGVVSSEPRPEDGSYVTYEDLIVSNPRVFGILVDATLVRLRQTPVYV